MLAKAFTTCSAASYNNLSFSFLNPISFSAEAGNAGRTLFLLSQAYSGDPSNLNATTAGFIASDTSVLNLGYVRDPDGNKICAVFRVK